jgi:hypothetical protein
MDTKPDPVVVIVKAALVRRGLTEQAAQARAVAAANGSIAKKIVSGSGFRALRLYAETMTI